MTGLSRAYLEEIGGLPASMATAEAKAPAPNNSAASGSRAPSATGGQAPPELSKEELDKMTKEERKAYYEARRSAQNASDTKAAQPLTKAQRRAIQEAQRKVKEEKQQAGMENKELLEELKLQGLSEDQAKEVMLAMLEAEDLPDEEEEDGDEETLLACVKSWMAEQGPGEVERDALSDFMLKVRFQGHVETTPPDHLSCILQLLVEQALQGFDLSEKLIPKRVAKHVQAQVARWAPFMSFLYEKVEEQDAMEAADCVVGGVAQGIEATTDNRDLAPALLVGCLMAVQEVELIPDEDLATGCRRSQYATVPVVEKYIDFLEAEEDDD